MLFPHPLEDIILLFMKRFKINSDLSPVRPALFFGLLNWTHLKKQMQDMNIIKYLMV